MWSLGVDTIWRSERGRKLVLTDLDPVDEASDLPSNCFGFLSRDHVVVLRGWEPIHHDNISCLFSVVQSLHQLGHPALEHTTDLEEHSRGVG